MLLASFIGTALMGLLANLPFALSTGMDFAYTIVLGFGYSWQIALLAVFVEGVIFIILSLTGDFRFRAGDLFFCANEQKKPRCGGLLFYGQTSYIVH